MANEARVNSSLGIRIASAAGVVQLDYQSRPGSFVADVSVAHGPTPGAFQAAISGTDVDLSKLTTPGLCVVSNLDDTNYVTVGVYEPNTDYFYPVLDLLPGESYVVRLARFVDRELTGTGTVSGGYNSTLRVVANTASCWVRVDAFEK